VEHTGSEASGYTMPQPAATTHGQDDSVTPNKPVDPGLVGWEHMMLAQLRERTGDGVGSEAALRAARAVFLTIGDRQGLAVADTVARR
jgi:hypothetical protein